ncbi:MAG TPA: hypothetical protein DCW68_04245 [Rhodospirillaceae bacterium]|nr:MAG: hypothetical protein A2018_07430 [Alphaproteobacteria bacterium GWF2_58_20]HAU29306.1 hypothetical protein [Rhodospirillaceae bacterium]
MFKKYAFIALVALVASSHADARQNGMRPDGMMNGQQMMNSGNASGNRPGAGTDMKPMRQDRQNRMQERMETRTENQEKRIETMCSRGTSAVERMKQSGMPSEMVSLASRHQEERCEMNRRQFTERKTLMEQLKAQGIAVPPTEELPQDDDM